MNVRRVLRRACVLAVVLIASGLLTSAAAPVASSAATVDGGLFHVRASSMHTSGLVYLGSGTVPTGDGGSVAVLHLASDSIAAVSSEIDGPCLASRTLSTSATSATSTTVTLDATSFTATVGGASVVFTVADPPALPFPAELDLVAVDVAAVSMTATHVSEAGLRTSVGSC